MFAGQRVTAEGTGERKGNDISRGDAEERGDEVGTASVGVMTTVSCPPNEFGIWYAKPDESGSGGGVGLLAPAVKAVDWGVNAGEGTPGRGGRGV